MWCRQKPCWVGRGFSCSPTGRTRQKRLVAAEKRVISRSRSRRASLPQQPPKEPTLGVPSVRGPGGSPWPPGNPCSPARSPAGGCRASQGARDTQFRESTARFKPSPGCGFRFPDVWRVSRALPGWVGGWPGQPLRSPTRA